MFRRNYSTYDDWQRDATDEAGQPRSKETALNAALPGTDCPACEGVGAVVRVFDRPAEKCRMCKGTGAR